jgi:hypothetical protein
MCCWLRRRYPSLSGFIGFGSLDKGYRLMTATFRQGGIAPPVSRLLTAPMRGCLCPLTLSLVTSGDDPGVCCDQEIDFALRHVREKYYLLRACTGGLEVFVTMFSAHQARHRKRPFETPDPVAAQLQKQNNDEQFRPHLPRRIDP